MLRRWTRWTWVLLVAACRGTDAVECEDVSTCTDLADDSDSVAGSDSEVGEPIDSDDEDVTEGVPSSSEESEMTRLIEAAQAQEWPDAGGLVVHQLPFESGVHMGIYQGPNCGSHAGTLEGSIDFNIAGSNYESTRGIKAAASAAGTVVGLKDSVSGFLSGSYGNFVLLRHSDGTFTIYAHLVKGSVTTAGIAMGQEVCAGQVLGVIGQTGEAYGDHLHYEQRDPTSKRVKNPTFVELPQVPPACNPTCDTSNHTSGCYESTNEALACGGVSGLDLFVDDVAVFDHSLTLADTFVELEFRAGNLGDAAPNGDVRYAIYGSTDVTITTADVLLNGPFTMGQLTVAGGASGTLGGPGTLSRLSPGTWYIGVIIDVDGAHAELDEANNVAVDPLPLVLAN